MNYTLNLLNMFLAESDLTKSTQLIEKLKLEQGKGNIINNSDHRHWEQQNINAVVSILKNDCPLCPGALITRKHVLVSTLCINVLFSEPIIFSSVLLAIAHKKNVEEKEIECLLPVSRSIELTIVIVSSFTKNLRFCTSMSEIIYYISKLIKVMKYFKTKRVKFLSSCRNQFQRHISLYQ